MPCNLVYSAILIFQTCHLADLYRYIFQFQFFLSSKNYAGTYIDSRHTVMNRTSWHYADECRYLLLYLCKLYFLNEYSYILKEQSHTICDEMMNLMKTWAVIPCNSTLIPFSIIGCITYPRINQKYNETHIVEELSKPVDFFK